MRDKALKAKIEEYARALEMERMARQKRHDAPQDFQRACEATAALRVQLNGVVDRTLSRRVVHLDEGRCAVVQFRDVFKEAIVLFFDADGYQER